MIYKYYTHLIRNCDELLRVDWFWLEFESTT